MIDYHLYFIDEQGAIQAREDFYAPGDDTALAVSDAVGRACSDTCGLYELWSGARLVTSFDASRANSLLGLTDEQTIEVQHITLTLEESLQRSRRLIAHSQRLLTEMELVRRHREVLLRRTGTKEALTEAKSPSQRLREGLNSTRFSDG